MTRTRILWFGLIVACTLLIYWPALGASWTGEDYTALEEATGANSIWFLFTTPTLHAFYRPTFLAVIRGVSLFGITHPFPFRFCSLVLHWGNAILVVKIAELFYSRSGMAPRVVAHLAGFAGLLFAVLPRLSEAIAWTASMHVPIASACIMCTVYAAMKFQESGNRMFLIMVGFGTVLGLMSREIAATVPALMACLSFFLETPEIPKANLLRRILRSLRNPTVVLSGVIVAVYLILRVRMLQGIGGYGLDTGGGTLLRLFVSNIVRYPISTFSIPQVVLDFAERESSLVLAGALTLGLFAYSVWRKRYGRPTSLMEKQHAPEIVRWYGVSCLASLYFFTIVPTFQLSPSWTMNNGGRFLYAGGPWLVIAFVERASLLVKPKILALVGICLITVYMYFGRISSWGYVRSGVISDYIIEDYVAQCAAHPRSRPVFIATLNEVGGYFSMYGRGLSAAIRLNRSHLPDPGIPFVGINPYSDNDEYTTLRTSDSTFRISVTGDQSTVESFDGMKPRPKIDRMRRLSPTEVEMVSSEFVPRGDSTMLLTIRQGHLQKIN